jgi:hypothetical protein
MRKPTIAVAVLAMLFSAIPSQSLAANFRPWCGTPSPSRELASDFVQKWTAGLRLGKTVKSISIPIAFHVVTDGRNGRLPLSQIQVLIDNLNWAYRDTPFDFWLYRADTVKNPSWYKNCVGNAANFSKLRKRMARDVRYYVNVYSCKPGVVGLLGISTFPPGYPVPNNPGLNYLQGIAIDPDGLGSDQYPYGFALAHEVGHYLGLFHTFEHFFNPDGALCADPGDFVNDTATQASYSLGECPSGIDTCPALSGIDDVHNFMNYTKDECMENFSPGQGDMMLWAVQTYRSTLGTR